MQRLPGWTLTETLVSMAIVFLLSGSVGYAGLQQVERAREAAARMQINTFAVALETYALDCGAYPTTTQGLDALWAPPVVAPVPTGWRGPYLAAPVPPTPWGGRYRYAAPGSDGAPWSIETEGREARR